MPKTIEQPKENEKLNENELNILKHNIKTANNYI